MRYFRGTSLWVVIASVVVATAVLAADVIVNGTFTGNLDNWTTATSGSGVVNHDSSQGGNGSGSAQIITATGRNRQVYGSLSQTISTTIDPTDEVYLSLWWYKYSGTAASQRHNLYVRIIRPAGDSVDIWSETTTNPGAEVSVSDTVNALDVSSFFDASGTYTIRLVADLQSGMSNQAYAQANFDDVILDVLKAANSLPSVSNSATGASPATVNRAGTNTTTVSTTFSDADEPGAAAFTVTFKVREPDNSTEVTLVNAQTDGSGGLSITDNGGGSYTASYDWDPSVSQALGDYDLYFEVSDGADNAIDNYTANSNELTIFQQYAPSMTAGATQASPANVNRVAANSTTISAVFQDDDIPGVGAFTVTFKVREPNNSTEVTLVNAQTDGTGGLSITDNGGGSYTASYDWDPVAAQTLGDYDLYFEVSDGTDSAVDDFTANPDELTVFTQFAPTVANGAAQASPATVNRVGANTTTISAMFVDSDQPPAGTFTVTFKVREPNNSTEVVLVNAQTDGSGGLTVTDNAGGNYTASYDWDPGPAQTLGSYDLYFEVNDGLDNAIDDYAANSDELTVNEQNDPIIAVGATQVSPASINRWGTGTTTISTTFSDADQPAVGTFTVTFKVREPDNSTEMVLADALSDGVAGLTVTDNGGGSYTASYDWDPTGVQTVGDYDLYFEVSDGAGSALDDYADNLDELTVFQQIAPTVASGVTTGSPAGVNTYGTNTATLTSHFTDADQPGSAAFTVTFKVREPNDATEVLLVDGLTHGNGGLNVTDDGGGSYTATYDWDPDDAQTVGDYDIYFEVSDGLDNAVDDFGNNPDELNVFRQVPPTITTTAATVSPVPRVGTDITTIYGDFTDPDLPGVGAFTVNIKVREPDNATEVILAANATNGSGVIITDLGGGDYRAEVDWDPIGIQTLGLYDLYFDVTDGVDLAVDDYTNNLDELEVIHLPSQPPVVASGATQVSPATVNRLGAGTTTISAAFSDADVPGVGAFTVTFKVRQPDNVTEVILVNALTDGNGGLTITDLGSGNYTASYTWDPADAQTIGLYDLYFEVFDGSSSATDDYLDNLDELNIFQQAAPAVAAGATAVSVSPVNRLDANTTTVSATFTDADEPGPGAFTCTFKIREPDDATELILVNALTNGNGGLSVVDNGSGSYTASYVYNPDDAQPVGFYDLYFEVSDGGLSDIDTYGANANELQIIEQVANSAPVIASGATTVSVTPVNRWGANTTTISAAFTDADQPAAGSFFITIAVREPDNSTVLTLVDAKQDGSTGLTVTDLGSGSYTVEYVYDPLPGQILGLYDLRVQIDDGVDVVVDDFANNIDELEIIESVPNNPPQLAAGATATDPDLVNRWATYTTTVSASFYDPDVPGINAFVVTFKVREPNNTTELTLVDAQSNGGGGLSVIDLGSGTYRAEYSYNPDDAQTIGMYDLYCEVSDGTDLVADDYVNNLDELEIFETVGNTAPTLTAGATTPTPGSVDRLGAFPTTLSLDFNDPDDPGPGAFYITFKARAPFSQSTYVVADSLADGQGGMTITAGVGDLYTASINWDPPDDAVLGYYDLMAIVSDGVDSDTDYYDDNVSDLLIANGGENAPPVVPSDAVFASPTSVERIGANPVTLSATFSDADEPAVSEFRVSFKLREPDDIAEVILADNLANGVAGVTITDIGGGVYTASVSWDPPAIQTLGFYDLYFHVTDQIDTSYDFYGNNTDELEIYDAVTSNNVPTVVSGAVNVTPGSVNRIGTEFTVIRAPFTDADMPGVGAFVVTIKARDISSTEYTLVNAANHGEQGLRVQNLGDGDYEASVLWDPDVAQPTGVYDLYFYVEDEKAASVIDDYTANTDELTITSSALLGDGYLLKRTNDSANCMSCHNLPEHQSQGCTICHAPHSVRNIFLVQDTIQTPNSGPKEVIFKTLGIGDPYNDPDPVVGDPTSGVFADDEDGVHTGVCEVCHTTVHYHRNDDSHSDQGHHNAEDCTACHSHSAGFSGAESEGGLACTCHQAIFDTMDSLSVAHRHILANMNADYSPGASVTYTIKNCLTCHVDHNIFRSDTNPGIGQRAKNLRVDWAVDPVLGDASVLSNSDYSSTGNGGICLSCHSGPSCLGCHTAHRDVSDFSHKFIAKADYDAATSAHNYDVPSTFSRDGSTFNANCVKCHTDDLSRTYQNSTYKFSAHGSSYENILSALGITPAANPLEESFCFKCHSTTSNPNAGSNLDYFGVKSITNPEALDIEDAFTRTYTHPTLLYSGRHSMADSAQHLGDGNRHAECEDCHNPHAAIQGTHDGTSNLVSNALKGAWGVEPTSWPTPATPTDNGNVFTAPGGFTKVDPATREYQICLKCHSNYTTLPTGARNLAEEINPNYPSSHAIVQAGDNPYCNSLTMIEPWGTNKINYCSDCHTSDAAGDPKGPHGSNTNHLLVASIVSSRTAGTPLCFTCHDELTYWSVGCATCPDNSKFPDHPASMGSHRLAPGCFSCHMWDYSSTAGLGVSTTNWPGGDDATTPSEPPISIFVHGQNKKWVYNEQDGSAGTGQDVENFVNGYIADLDHVGNACWSNVCKSHSNKAY